MVVTRSVLLSCRFQPPYAWGGKYAFLGLAAPGETGSWQTESKVKKIPMNFTVYNQLLSKIIVFQAHEGDYLVCLLEFYFVLNLKFKQ